jgi:hypothetical protein
VSTALARLTNLLPEVIRGECLNPRQPNRAHGAGRISDGRRNVKMLAAYLDRDQLLLRLVRHPRIPTSSQDPPATRYSARRCSIRGDCIDAGGEGIAPALPAAGFITYSVTGRMILRRQADPGSELAPDLNSFGSGVFIVSWTAPIGPTPGILARRRLHSSARCQAMSLASISSICVCSCVCSFAWMAALEPRQAGSHRLGRA